MSAVRDIIKKTVIKAYKSRVLKSKADKNMIVFDSSTGTNYTGSPRAIYEKMVKMGLDKKYKCVWFFKKGHRPTHIPGRAKIVTFGRWGYLKAMIKAGVWIFDTRQPEFLVKKPDQIYIQTWHGTPLKKLALDMEDVSMAGEKDLAAYKESFAKNAASWDYLIAQNDFSAETFRRCFAFKGEMLKIGYPRNDVLFEKDNEKDIAALKEKYGIPGGKKVLLYAPTFRDNEYGKGREYKFTPKLDFDLLKKELSDEYIVLVKYHYLICDKVDWEPYRGFVYPFTGKDEISELYLIADALITDYSSVMFDYSILERPMYFYAYDLESYRDELRGFYFDFISEAPGPVSKTTEELISDIKKYGISCPEEFKEKRENFEAKYHTYENGNAAERVIHIIGSRG
ncbi:MAG: CDP-glycerol glycerophosphotransferase family protein [Lachnospiraceae bacterium]|nr:CDP-glycerol glycerophosphotransferase family protein [Lachnospiraceae bacterium]